MSGYWTLGNYLFLSQINRWIKGGYGVGKRISIETSTRIIDAINKGELDQAETYNFKYFNFAVPKHIEGVDSKLLKPESNWEGV